MPANILENPGAWFAAQPSSFHERQMDLALREARKAADEGEVPMGCVIVRLRADGSTELVGKAHNGTEGLKDPTAHAEVLAIREAAAAVGEWRLAGCTLVVTLEPCAMCAGAIVLARVPRVVFGAWDEKAGASGSVFDILRERRLNHWVEVFPGVREEESARLLWDFFGSKRNP